MEIYESKERKKKLEVIHFGLVKGGQTKEITVWLYNESKALLTNLEFQLKKNIPQAERVEIVDPPTTIQPGMSYPLKLRWSPTKTLKEALEVMVLITGDEVYLAKRQFTVAKEAK